MPAPDLNIGFDHSGRLKINEDFAAGWRLAQVHWRFSRHAKCERAGQAVRVTLSCCRTKADHYFTPVNPHASRSARQALAVTAPPGESEPPQFEEFSDTQPSVRLDVKGSVCSIVVDLFDAHGDFNQTLAWQALGEAAAFKSRWDLWAQPLLFTDSQTTSVLGRRPAGGGELLESGD